MVINFLLHDFEQFNNLTAIIWKEKEYSYSWLLKRINYWKNEFPNQKLKCGAIVALEGDFTPESIACFLSLIANNCIIVPQIYSNRNNIGEKYDIAEVQFIVTIDEFEAVTITKRNSNPNHELNKIIIKRGTPGLILFSSGTSGKPKGAVHDFAKLLEKFKTKRKSLKILNFLLFDHWGGLNTMLHTLSNGGVVITVQDRSPEGISRMIQDYKIEVLPASPTLLNLLLISGAYKNYDFSSLKIISYGTEPMPESTLNALNELFPGVKLLQTYGLIEVGVLRSKSKDNNSLWVKIGGEGYETRIVDNMLEIKADSAMLGYLNATSPFTEDGWFMTGDAVEQDGEYIKILGRKSELINVGGEKVYPAEVESVIQELEFITDVEVYGEKNPLSGNIVCARVKVDDPSNFNKLKENIKSHCSSKLERFKVPIKIKMVDQNLHSFRFKKMRAHE
jgi:acyl-coenzyme A synthetase/AMP-(fatty) acid ligase